MPQYMNNDECGDDQGNESMRFESDGLGGGMLLSSYSIGGLND